MGKIFEKYKLFSLIALVVFCLMPLRTDAIVIEPAEIKLDIESGKQTILTLGITNDSKEIMTVVPEVEAYTLDELRRPHFGATDISTNWVRPSSVEVTIQPAEKVSLLFPVSVPIDAEPGSHFLALLVRQITKQTNGDYVAAGARVGALLTLQVTGQPIEKIELEKISAPIFSFDEKIPVTVSMKNSGTVSSQIVGDIFATNFFGSVVAAGKLNPEGRQILPGTSKNDSFILNLKSWQSIGPIKIQVSAKYGDPEQTIVKKILIWHFPKWFVFGFGFITLAILVLTIFLVTKRKRV